MSAACRWLRGAAVLLAALLPLAAQKPADTKDDDEIQKLAPTDPYTGKDEALMKAAGVVGYGPFPWADFKTTADVDRVLGEKRILWLETAHFRIGLGLKSTGWPEGQEQKKYLQDEIRQLRKKLPKVPEKPKKIDPWLRLHLYAQRLEALYAEFQKLLGVTDADFPAKGPAMREGAYLGMPDKYLVLLLQKKSDMARYMDRFCGQKEEVSMRWYHRQTHQLLAALSAEGLEGFDELGLYGHAVYAVTHNLLNGYNGFHYPLPLWLDEGVSHWFARKVPSEMLNVQILDSEAVAQDKQNDWPVKVRRRAQHAAACFDYATMAGWQKWEELGYHAHSQSWSRVDFLMQRDKEKLGLLLKQLKSQPPPSSGALPPDQLAALTAKLLLELYELEGPGFDTAWREWVLKTYPKK